MPEQQTEQHARIPLSPEQYSEIFDIGTQHDIQARAYIDPDSVPFSRQTSYLLHISEAELSRLLSVMPDQDTDARGQLQRAGERWFGW